MTDGSEDVESNDMLENNLPWSKKAIHL
jgi:hypothetical protein